ncbi:unnamed protein product [Triticum turgidum subsp. durum]|uniref:non-specific serine/threonine protein kinase n=1 Tax=Triticum turgidum subsp. durum TaxID=4567 RepID=A0A9R0YEK7_TRITD|nr:unnamed protein product [Triticum turgidum subsp. durum]
MRAQHPNVTRLVGYCYHLGHQCIKQKGEYVFAHVEERVLCFEYLQGGSLDNHISGMMLLCLDHIVLHVKENYPLSYAFLTYLLIYIFVIDCMFTYTDESCGLDWPTRFKIVKGVCEGLNYLHNGCKDPIYHLDLKPANVLLDKNMFPKIGDFGLSRLFPLSQTYITSKIIGTP